MKGGILLVFTAISSLVIASCSSGGNEAEAVADAGAEAEAQAQALSVSTASLSNGKPACSTGSTPVKVDGPGKLRVSATAVGRSNGESVWHLGVILYHNNNEVERATREKSSSVSVGRIIDIDRTNDEFKA